jgi:hypothetical protein
VKAVNLDLPLVVAIATICTLTLWVAAVALQYRADEECRERAEDTGNVTLCRGELYAVNLFGEIECACR